MLAKEYIGKRVKVKMDRPLGTKHPPIYTKTAVCYPDRRFSFTWYFAAHASRRGIDLRHLISRMKFDGVLIK